MARDAVPLAQLPAAFETEFVACVGDVKLHRVEADLHALGDDAVGHAVAHSFDDAPFGGRQRVGMRRAPALAHGRQFISGAGELPSPLVGYRNRQ